jgi:hypothetical protein
MKYSSEYMEKYPDAQQFWLYVETYSIEKMIEIFENSKGRKVIFETTDNLDELLYYYE